MLFKTLKNETVIILQNFSLFTVLHLLYCIFLSFCLLSCGKAFLFLFVGLHHLPHFDFGKSKKKKKNYKSQKMQTGCDKFFFKMLPSKSSNHF